MKPLKTFSLATKCRCFVARKMCVNAQDSDPIKNYEFYLKLEKHRFGDVPEFEPKVDPRQTLRPEFTPKSKSYWAYDPTMKISIGFPQIEWITKSHIHQAYPPSIISAAGQLDENEVSEKLKEILRECYVFDTKEYQRIIKVPKDPDDRWNPYFVKKPLDFPLEARMTRNFFSSVLSFGLQISSARTRPYVTFGGQNQVFFERGGYAALLRHPGEINVLGKHPLSAQVSSDEVSTTVDKQFERFYPLSPMLDFKQTNLYHDFESFGVSSSLAMEKYHPHVAFLPTVTLKPERMQYATCLFAFANALAKAHVVHGSEEVDLPTPIVSHCIASTGFDLHFATCQLNTTRFSTDSGIKNLIWSVPNVKLFSAVRREFELYVEDYNKHAGLNLVAYITDGLLEKSQLKN